MSDYWGLVETEIKHVGLDIMKKRNSSKAVLLKLFLFEIWGNQTFKIKYDYNGFDPIPC